METRPGMFVPTPTPTDLVFVGFGSGHAQYVDSYGNHVFVPLPTIPADAPHFDDLDLPCGFDVPSEEIAGVVSDPCEANWKEVLDELAVAAQEFATRSLERKAILKDLVRQARVANAKRKHRIAVATARKNGTLCHGYGRDGCKVVQGSSGVHCSACYRKLGSCRNAHLKLPGCQRKASGFGMPVCMNCERHGR